MKESILHYAPEHLESAEETLKLAAIHDDKGAQEFFADSVGDDSIEFSRLMMNLYKASISKEDGDLVKAIVDIEERLLLNSCAAFDSGAWVS